MSLIPHPHTHTAHQINFKLFSAIIVYKTEKYWSNAREIAFYYGKGMEKYAK